MERRPFGKLKKRSGHQNIRPDGRMTIREAKKSAGNQKIGSDAKKPVRTPEKRFGTAKTAASFLTAARGSYKR
jgi:hypothetical protein